jgi:hypothetical protein
MYVVKLTERMRCITMWNKTAPNIVKRYSSLSRLAAGRSLAKKIHATLDRKIKM